MKYLFLDTNIFLHFKYFSEIPWSEIVSSDDITIVIAPIVVDELDRKKNDQNSKISKKAKKIVSRLEDFIDKKSDLIKVILLDKKPSPSTFKTNNLQDTHGDDCLYASIIEFRINNGDEKLLFTNDIGVKIRAIPHKINCLKLSEEYRLEEEQDPLEIKLRDTQRELEEIKNKAPIVSLTFSNKESRLFFTPKVILDKKKFIEEKLNLIKIKNAYLSQNRLTYIANDPFSRLSEKQILDYNLELDKFYSRYELYLEEKYQYDVYRSSCLPIYFEIKNSGTTPANDIDICLHFPDGFDLSENLKMHPEAPKPPYKPKSQFDFGLSAQPLFPTLLNSNSTKTSSNQFKPHLTKLEKTNSYDVEFKLPNLKHNKELPFSPIYACFENVNSMKNFHIDYSLIIANVSKKVEGKLHVIFSHNLQ